jgi:hypothetical protein
MQLVPVCPRERRVVNVKKGLPQSDFQHLIWNNPGKKAIFDKSVYPGFEKPVLKRRQTPIIASRFQKDNVFETVSCH